MPPTVPQSWPRRAFFAEPLCRMWHLALRDHGGGVWFEVMKGSEWIP
jgi:hypothetical protein